MAKILPVIHLNGTSRAMLLRDYQKAYEALASFRDAFCQIEFHARDYYVHPQEGAWATARDERDAMQARVGELMQYLEAHLIHLAD